MKLKLVGGPCHGKEVFFIKPPPVIKVVVPEEDRPSLYTWSPDQLAEPYRIETVLYHLVRYIKDKEEWVQYEPGEMTCP